MQTNVGLARKAANEATDSGKIVIGTGQTAADPTDLTLEAEIATVGRFAVLTATSAANVCTVVGVSPKMLASQEVGEAGVLLTGDDTSMLSRSVFTPQTVGINIAAIVEVVTTFT